MNRYLSDASLQYLDKFDQLWRKVVKKMICKLHYAPMTND